MASPSSDISRRNTSVFLLSGAGATNGVDFQTQLQQPILIDDQTEVALASIALEYEQAITISPGSNIFRFQLSKGGTIYNASIQPGQYDPPGLADAIQMALNQATVGDPLMNQFGSFQCSWDKVTLRYIITYQQVTTRSVVVATDLNLFDADFAAGGGFTRAATATGDAVCTIKKPMSAQTGRVWCTVPTDTNFTVAIMSDPKVAWDPTAPPESAAAVFFAVSFDKATQEFTPYIRGVAQTPIPALRPPGPPPGPLPDIILVVAKLGQTVYVGYRWTSDPNATDPLEDVLEEAMQIAEVPTNQQLYVSFATPDAARTITTITNTPDPYFTGVTIEVGGVTYELADATELAKHDTTIHALMYGKVADGPPIAQAPPFPAGGQKITFNFPTASLADLMGFVWNTDLPSMSPYSWSSTRVPLFSFDSTGVQSSIYITSSSLNVGSRFQAPGVSTSQFILGSAPVVARYFASETHLEYSSPDPFYNTLVLGDKQVLSAIDITIRDSSLKPLVMPTGTPSRCTLELRFRNHPVA
jgi:hypothetical protein